jgi:hypothetical protein
MYSQLVGAQSHAETDLWWSLLRNRTNPKPPSLDILSTGTDHSLIDFCVVRLAQY